MPGVHETQSIERIQREQWIQNTQLTELLTLKSYVQVSHALNLKSSKKLCALKFNAKFPGNRNKRKGNGAGLARESQSHCFADHYGNLTHTLLVQTHNMTTVKEIAEQCCQLQLSLNNDQCIVNFNQIIFFACKFGLQC